ncbi:hypothetical protein SJAG_04799 [Schizosaccharomyces japonicus yFS275]|uniref:WD-like domain-containing protein n=1 Tax=Schizosaccharomyces japonicus (strain yFS275 / FY16936) TaxID=402676 RepID=B6K7T2_SCHJY|nr:hypothetical protein SJAG_04799 [Schizosaccharomyces japonicus yFS275]EEB09586.1 hypothetical protein SJAG_04799 [Schizosaccharomyces japonicus yFS275]
MKLFSLSAFFLFLNIFGFVTAANEGRLSYDDLLGAFISGKLDGPSGGSGFIEVSPVKHQDAARRDSYFKGISMITTDNYEKLNTVSQMFDVAKKHRAIGDMLYLYNIINQDGNTYLLKLDQTSMLASEVCNYLTTKNLHGTAELFKMTTNPDLEDYYKNFDNSLCVQKQKH